MSQEAKDNIAARAGQIEKQAEYDEELMKEVYLKLGCTDEEASFLKDKRINSPGVRGFLEKRCSSISEALQIQKKYEQEINRVITHFRNKINQDPKRRDVYKEQGNEVVSELKTRMDDEMEILLFGGVR
jgi:hypothetical protein